MRQIFKQPYVWVLAAMAMGAGTGALFPETGALLKPLGDGFIALLKMLISPIIFLSVVTGIASAGDVKKNGRVGLKAMVYFEVATTIALITGMLFMHLLEPGRYLTVDTSSLNSEDIAPYRQAPDNPQLPHQHWLLQCIPATFVHAFTNAGNVLQVLLLAMLTGHALLRIGEHQQLLAPVLHGVSELFFEMMNLVMKLAPVGAFGAMAFTVSKFGAVTLLQMTALVLSFYLACFSFVMLVLGWVSFYCGFNLLKLLMYLRADIMTVVGTSSSESALVPLMQKLNNLGCPKSITGLVIPAGYSFNLLGTSIYLTMAALFLAQALRIHLSWQEELTLLGVAMVTSKSATGISGAGFMTLAATLAVVPSIPLEGLALIVGIDRLMSEARAVTNFIGNAVAGLVIARWEGELDIIRLQQQLASPPVSGGRDDT